MNDWSIEALRARWRERVRDSSFSFAAACCPDHFAASLRDMTFARVLAAHGLELADLPARGSVGPVTAAHVIGEQVWA